MKGWEVDFTKDNTRGRHYFAIWNFIYIGAGATKNGVEEGKEGYGKWHRKWYLKSRRLCFPDKKHSAFRESLKCQSLSSVVSWAIRGGYFDRLCLFRSHKRELPGLNKDFPYRLLKMFAKATFNKNNSLTWKLWKFVKCATKDNHIFYH